MNQDALRAGASAPWDTLFRSMAEGRAVVARDLPTSLLEASRMLHGMRRKEALVEMLPGTFCGVRWSAILKRYVPACEHVDAVTAYARAHGRVALPAPAAAANMVGLSLQVPGRHLYVWNGPVRRMRIRGVDRQAPGSPIDFDPMTPTGGLPHDLVLCLRRLKASCRRILGPTDIDPAGIVRSIAPGLVPADAFDGCRRASAGLVRALHARGVRADLVQHAGHLVERPRADERWKAIDRSSWIHWAVEVPDAGLHVALTFGQFDRTFIGPRVLPIADARAEWRDVH